MMRFITLLSLFFILCNASADAQTAFIYSKEGRQVLVKKNLVNSCLTGLHKTRSDSTALAICECQVNALDRRFTNKQYREHTSNNVIDISGLVKEDSLVQKLEEACYSNSGKTLLLQAEGFENEFMKACASSIYSSTEKTLNDANVQNFCRCQLQMIKTKKLTDAQVHALQNPNSLLFYEMMYTCGDPFTGKEEASRNWSADMGKDIAGPERDTIRVLNLNGMSYVQIKTGSMVQYWLLDTGASDLLINTDMEQTLKDEGILKQENYLGTGEYEMANGVIDTCRRYNISGVRIGAYMLNNMVVAVTEKGKKIIAGKALLNKFANWVLDNKTNTLIINR